MIREAQRMRVECVPTNLGQLVTRLVEGYAQCASGNIPHGKIFMPFVSEHFRRYSALFQSAS